LLYYITDRQQLGSDEPTRRRHLLEKVSEAARAGVDFIQLRERDLSARDLAGLAGEVLSVVRQANRETKLLINSRLDVAVAAGADGVHLRSDDLTASEERSIWARSTGRTDGTVAVSCHRVEEVRRAEQEGADFVVFGPVFGKQNSEAPATGTEGLNKIVRRGALPDQRVEAGQSLRMPVIALGGITLQNARACVEAGAAGIAGIRLFQENNCAHVVQQLR